MLKKLLSLIFLFFFNAILLAETSEKVIFSELDMNNGVEIKSYSGQHFDLTFFKGTNSISPKYYTAGSAVRCYGGNYFTVTSETIIGKIVFNFASGDGTNAINPSCGDLNENTWIGESDSIVFMIGGISGHRKISAIEVFFPNIEDGDTIQQDTIPVTPIDSSEFVETDSVKFASMIPGDEASTCTVNKKNGVKVGTSKKSGNMSIVVPAKTEKLIFYAAAWKGVTDLKLNITNVDIEPFTLLNDDGISSNSPFTLIGDEEDYRFEIILNNVSEETELIFSADKRFVIWNATYETKEEAVIPTNIEMNVDILKPKKIFDGIQIMIKQGNKTYNILGLEI